jgi:hypothetical protein
VILAKIRGCEVSPFQYLDTVSEFLRPGTTVFYDALLVCANRCFSDYDLRKPKSEFQLEVTLVGFGD